MRKFLKMVLITLGVLVLVAVLLVMFLLFQFKRNQVKTQTFTASDGAQIQYDYAFVKKPKLLGK